MPAYQPGHGALAPGTAVLVVDDDAAMVRLIAGMLNAAGIPTIAAFDAIQGFMVAQRQHPRLVLVDWHMPAGGGPQLLRRLAELPATHHIPVVVITADDSAALPEEVRALGARQLLRKPVDPVDLTRLVRELLPAAS